MTLPLDIAILGAPDVAAARDFYSSAFSPAVEDYGGFSRLDLHGTGSLGVTDSAGLAAEAGGSAESSGFRGFILSYVLEQPSEVASVLDAAATAGCEILRPAKKALFGSFSGAFRAPDGAIWKVSSDKKKDTAAAQTPPQPIETGVLLGVADPKTAKDFYTGLGMVLDRDYGSRYIDFSPAQGALRLGLMQRKDLAKDVGLAPEGSGFQHLVLSHDAASQDEVNGLFAKAEAAGATITAAPTRQNWGGYTGHFMDPAGITWKIAAAS